MSRVHITFSSSGEIADYTLDPCDRDPDSRIWKAIVLTKRVEVCDALLRDESVPIDSLDHDWLERLGGRP